jgi:glc operon protein GlcG
MTSRGLFLAAAMLILGPATEGRAITVSVAKPTVTHEAARVMIDVCKAIAAKNDWKIAFAVVDQAGNLVAYEHMDGASVIAQQAAPAKARAALRWRRPSKLIEDRFAEGSREAVWLGDFAVQGGLPIIADGKAIGGFSASGVDSADGENCAREGLKAVLGNNPLVQETR